MTDREKVITALAICTGKCKCVGCWYGQNNPDFRCQDRLKADALALFREHKAVEPTRKVNENGQILSCGNCGAWLIVQKQKYCHECGQAVKWNAETSA